MTDDVFDLAKLFLELFFLEEVPKFVRCLGVRVDFAAALSLIAFVLVRENRQCHDRVLLHSHPRKGKE